MNLDTEFISAMCAWCRKNGIEWEYNSLTLTHSFIKYPLDPVERSLQECFSTKSFPSCHVSHHLMLVNSCNFDQRKTISPLTDLIYFRIKSSGT